MIRLEPYFDEIEHFIGVSGPEKYPWGKKSKQALSACRHFPLMVLHNSCNAAANPWAYEHPRRQMRLFRALIFSQA